MLIPRVDCITKNLAMILFALANFLDKYIIFFIFVPTKPYSTRSPDAKSVTSHTKNPL